MRPATFALLSVILLFPTASVLASSPDAQRSITAHETRDFVGTWECKTSDTKTSPKGSVTMTQIDVSHHNADGTATGAGSLRIKTFNMDAKWTFKGSGSWRIAGGEMCGTVKKITMTPVNFDAKQLEKKAGKSMSESFPLGKENCKKILEKTKRSYVVLHQGEIRTRCKLKDAK